MTLQQFVRKCGGQYHAAVKVGVLPSTIWRWLNKESVPKGNNARRLLELGVKFS